MSGLDQAVILAYVLATFGLGLLAGGRRSAGTVGSFFLGDRRLRWWALGTSMVATTLAADTPLAVAGLTVDKGVAGNWFWWSMALSHVLVAVVLGRLWRRSGVVTDAEFCELRYGGRAAGALRSLKAFYFAVPINCMVLGWVFLAMVKVGRAVLPEMAPWKLLGGLLLLTLVYSLRSGFRAVVFTDLFQFPIAMAGAVVLAWVAVSRAGGLGAVVAHAVEVKGHEVVELFPLGGDLLPWHTLLAFLGVQWWAQKYADGGGIFVQRLLAARDERQAELGGIWFCVAHYVLRPWPWILTGLASMALVPAAAASDAERAYATLIVQVLPPGMRGLLVASFLAAFMSTLDTHLNWGASYVVNDLLKRLRPELVPLVSRLAVVLMAGFAVLATTMMDTIAGAWEFVIAFGAGAGAVILLRWYWWRVTAWAEIAAMVASTAISVLVYTVAPEGWPYLQRLLTIVAGSAVFWIPVALLTTPHPAALLPFFRKVRPPGPGWAAVARSGGLPAPPSIAPDLLRWATGLGGILACLLGSGRVLLGHPVSGLISLLLGVILTIGVALTPRPSLSFD